MSICSVLFLNSDRSRDPTSPTVTPLLQGAPVRHRSGASGRESHENHYFALLFRRLVSEVVRSRETRLSRHAE